ncbi:MAG: hypothetical protein M1826_000219 [Phylliscum demangeonii]|nr:MAG: hypothetical protein M1826_000219 [Phylliscum demangeonii]
MTVFVVSLFLPYTIHFDAPERAPASFFPAGPLKNGAANGTTNGGTNGGTAHRPPQTPSLFDGGLTPAATLGTVGMLANGSIIDHDDFFSRMRPATPGNAPRLRQLGANTSAWGSNPALNQPRPSADPAPPRSILEHGKLAMPPQANGFGKMAGVSRAVAARVLRSASKYGQATWTVERSERGNGGLRAAVNAAGGGKLLQDLTWVGTLGMPTDALDDKHQRMEMESKLHEEHDCLTVWCKDGDMDGHYTHYCKQILWPVLHYQIPDNPKSKAYEDHSWIYYEAVNQAFADKIIKNYKRGDVIWVHDYHLFRVPAMVRKKIAGAKIGFFMHAAFPSSEVFRCLAVREQLLNGLLGANLIGFQTEEYRRHFLQTCSRLLCVEATNEGVQLEDRFVNVIHLAIGIDPHALDTARQHPDVAEWIREIHERYPGKKLIVARDKLNHVRGVRQKLLAYELFLHKYPAWREQTVLIQVAQKSPSLAPESELELDLTVAEIVSRVNSTHASLTHQPLVFLRQDISFSQYLALLTVADALMITSLREGMNLTCHEFIHCQDGAAPAASQHGPLILSEFTGSAAVFGGAELSVNPWDHQQCADAIHTALQMPAAERQQRWQRLHDVVTYNSAAYWTTTFLARLATAYAEQEARTTESIPRLSIPALGQAYAASQRRLFILDYEGTLASWGAPHSIILTSPQRTIDVLNDLLLDAANTVYVMSGRQTHELDRLFARVPGLGIIAENGCFWKAAGEARWRPMADPAAMDAWKTGVLHILKYYRERTEGSWIEALKCSLIFHYPEADDAGPGARPGAPDAAAADRPSAARQASDCADHLNDAGARQRLHATMVAGAVRVEPIDWSKATAAALIFDGLQSHGRPPPDFLMVAGDDRDDECIFRWANQLAADAVVPRVTTVCVAPRTTEAQASLTQGVSGMLSALQKLAALATHS